MELTKKNIVENSYIYEHKHAVTEGDVKKANKLKGLIEKRLIAGEKIPLAGDIIICAGPAKIYNNGHLNFNDPERFSSICVQPYVPFIFTNDDGNDVYFSSSGGYWFSAPEKEMLQYEGTREKLFKTWGWRGPCADGAFYFPATVNVWKIFLESIY